LSSKLPPYQPPSPFTPFLRRFTDERARDLSETKALYQEVRAAYLASPWSKDDAIDRVGGFVAEWVGETVDLPQCKAILEALDRCQTAVLALETTIFTSPQIDWDIAVLSLKEQVDLRRFLRAQQHFLANDDRTSEQLVTALGNVFGGLIKELPNIPPVDNEAALTVSLVTLMRDTGDVVDRIIGTICKSELSEAGLFTTLQQRLYENICRASGVDPFDEKPRRPLITADEADLAPEELVEAYLAGTPFKDLFLTPVPFVLPEHLRFEHMHIVGGSGHGKTQLLQHLILNDLKRDDPPSLIVIDSQGDMLKKIQRLDLFAESLADKLVIIDPEDIEHPAALNMFDSSNTRLAGYLLSHKEQIEAGVIELYNYIFSSIAAEMTSRQSTAFAFVTRLMLSIPGSTIHTLRELMEEPAQTLAQSKLAEHIRKLDPTSQAYFENQFFTKRYADLRQQIARRLYSVLSVPSFNRMFSSKENKLDMFECMQSGKVVLINTSKALLKSDASALFGRYIIALTIMAAFERVATQNRPPAFLFIDEAAEYFDDNIEMLLSQARKFNLGLVIAHQHLDQLTSALRSSVAANTTIKLAGGVSDRDARALAPDMRTTADFLASMRKHQRSTEFACYVRNYTANAVRLEIPFGSVEAAPKTDAESFQRLLAQNRARLSHPPTPAEPAAEPAAHPPESITPAVADQAPPEEPESDVPAAW